jgi:GNAT superfamily N-acetyltransferase
VLELRDVPLDHPDAQELVRRALAFYVELYGGEDGGDADPTHPEHFVPPQGRFFVGYLDGSPVAAGGWRRSGLSRLGTDRTAEIKRMYVTDELRGRGLARAVLSHLEATAREAGFEALVLSTGAPQVAAVRLYSSAGYELIEPFGLYAASPACRCFAKRL